MVKTIWIGILAAAVGFSYSLATTTTSRGMPGHGSGHMAGSSGRIALKFTNPLFKLTTERDLGDAAFGSTIVRFVQARGGFPPRRFTSDHQNSAFEGVTSLSDANTGLPASVQPEKSTAILNLAGRLSGLIGDISGFTGPDIPLKFDVSVVDSRGSNPNKVTERYRLTMTHSKSFKFAQEYLSDGIAYRRYRDKIEVIAGHAPYKFIASQISLTDPTSGDIKSIAAFEDIGLFLSPKTGILTGRPLVTGKISFLLNCRDADGNLARSRCKCYTGWTFSFNVEANPHVATELFATSVSIKGDVTHGGNDSIEYTGVLNTDGTSVKSMKGAEVTLQIGDYTTPTVTLDETGKGSTAKSNTDPTVSVSISNTGQVKISVRNESFGKDGLIATTDSLTKNIAILAVEVSIGDFFDSNELLKFAQKAKSNLFQQTYKFGPGNLGGGFYITSVVGKDETGGPSFLPAREACSWKVNFMALPPNQQKISSAKTATVGIGTNFTDKFNVSNKNGAVLSDEKRDPAEPVVLKFALSPKGKGSLLTSFLPRTSSESDTNTDIPAALEAGGKNARFPMIITINSANGNTVFGAEGSRSIFPKGNTWISKDLTK